MKVLFLTNIPAPYRVDFFNLLSKKCDLTVLFEAEKSKNRNIEWFKDNKFNFKYIMLGNKGKIKQLFNVLRDKYDIIIIGTYSTRIAAISRFYLKWHKKPYIISADGGFISDKNFITKYIKRFFMSSASFWLSSGDETDKYLIYYGAKKENIYQIHFTSLLKRDIFDDEKVDKNYYKKKIGLNANKRVFLNVGRIDYNKGYDVFLNSLIKKNYKNVEFVVVGTGELESKYMKFINDNNLNNVHFVGFKNKEEVKEYYKAADLFFFNTRSDVWGLVINEAMANQLPVISTNMAIAALELINPKNLYDPEDQDALISLFEKYSVKSNDKLIKDGKQNLSKIKDYTIETMVEEHIKIFRDILKNDKI